MQDFKIDIYGADWCKDCKRAKKYLGEQRIHYGWYNIEEEGEEGKKAYDYVLEVNGKLYGKPKRKIPVIHIEKDGEEILLVEPTNAELAEKLGFATRASKTFYDVAIIGAGPAGLTAALYLARDGYDVLVIEKSTIGGQAYITSKLDNFPGFPDGISGEQFAKNLRKQVEKFGVEIVTPHEVSEILPCHDNSTLKKCPERIIKSKEGLEITCKAILVATGSEYKKLGGIPGLQELSGIAVHYCATCDGAFYKEKEIVVIGGGNSAFEETLYLRNKFARKVTMVVLEDDPIASPFLKEAIYNTEGIEVWPSHQVTEVKGEVGIEKITVRNNKTSEVKEIKADGIFIFIGLSPNTKFLPGEIELDKDGFLTTHDGFQSNVRGIFAAGDVRKGSVKQAVASAGEGAGSAIQIREYLES
ncbi:MAG: FAD-dependent oxidoreductase [Candidatus Hodarchaeota archaeon]